MTNPAQRLPHVTPARLARITALLGVLQAVSPRLAARAAFWLFLKPQRRGLTESDTEIMTGARVHAVTAGTNVFRVHEWGPVTRTDTRTVIILHGWGSRAGRFSLLAAELAARGWRVLAIDAPGHGLSAGSSSSLPLFMAALDAVATQLGPAQAVIGHSLGALAVVCARATSAPAWFASLQKLVLVSIPSGAPFLANAFLEMFRIGPATASHLRRHFRQHFSADPEFFMARPDATLQRLPALLVHDRGDDIVPFAHSEALLSAFASARLLATDTLGHSALTRDAATISAIAQFLDEGST
jgi:pimeloyl-ACP methyl ester carboxylesterase